MFENFEYSPALKFGLNAAIEEINNKGLGIIERDIKKKSIFFREKLECFSQVIFYENKRLLSGINTFNIKGFRAKEIYNYLLSKNILCSISTPESSVVYFKKKSCGVGKNFNS